MWPTDAEALRACQRRLAAVTPTAWEPPASGPRVGGCWVCFPRGYAGLGGAGDPAWSAAVVLSGDRLVGEAVRAGAAGAPYVPGMLALRVGALLEEVARALPTAPDVLLVDGTGLDHPRRAGLALHLGAELDVPTVGVTHRPLVAHGPWPGDVRGDTSPLSIDDEVVACWVRTRPGVRPLAVHPAWRTGLDAAVGVVLGAARHRTPEPLRVARRAARAARAAVGRPGSAYGTVGRGSRSEEDRS